MSATMTPESMAKSLSESRKALERVKYWIQDGQDPEDWAKHTGDLQDTITLLSAIHEQLLKEKEDK